MEKTLKFLAELNNNKNQSWLSDHSGEFENARAEMWDFAYLLLTQLSIDDAKLNTEIDVARFISNIIGVGPKKAVLYLDFFDIAISPLNNDGNEPAYLVHIEPNDQSYISIKYIPDVFGLQVMRNYIAKNASLFDSILQDCYSSGFILDESSKLPALPKGYPVGTPGESFIKLKKYEIRSHIDLLKDQDELIKDILTTFKAAMPFVQFLRTGLGL